MAEDRAIQGVRKVFCRMTGKICYYANENGYCDSTACHNMNVVGNIIPKERPENIGDSSIWVKPHINWNTGTPTETGLYVVLTEVETIGIHSSKGTYILDWWDGYCFKNLKGIVQNSPIHRLKEYSWVKWQKIEED